MSRVKDLVQRIHKSEEHKPYHPDLAARFPNLHRSGASALSALEREIAEEVAYSLGRAGKKIETLLQETQRLGAALDELSASDDRSPTARRQAASLHARFSNARTLTERAIRDLRIQREALGFRRHDDIEKRFVVPAPRPAPGDE